MSENIIIVQNTCVFLNGLLLSSINDATTSKAVKKELIDDGVDLIVKKVEDRLRNHFYQHHKASWKYCQETTKSGRSTLTLLL
jgi:hypothetical protein